MSNETPKLSPLHQYFSMCSDSVDYLLVSHICMCFAYSLLNIFGSFVSYSFHYMDAYVLYFSFIIHRCLCLFDRITT